MSAAELYKQFGITPAEYAPTDTPVDFVRRAIGSNLARVEQVGVSYSSGTMHRHSSKNTENSKNYVMYSY
ncbi:hypothetical protein ACRQKW_001576 [Citrobacter braakii]|uniref:hypothetical protein n=1 Tax=Citrobacter TaxID=544 RepID=UPI0012DC8B29|nr:MULTISPECIES: hypothetical protein [Citrobacter]MBJ9547953.1 hypothetical protein [Citrobacter braakii]MDU0999755.1 hypothetical protein [Citrobacter sp.]WFX97025.1 hypothetical protein NFK19_09575 [Citrobacter braakii]WFY06070.1 hypothetical protein NFK21_09575 [Citrobacter braakii]WFZ50203.1 hypothetical protein NFK67_09445 [Citrobacter braakii]